MYVEPQLRRLKIRFFFFFFFCFAELEGIVDCVDCSVLGNQLIAEVSFFFPLFSRYYNEDSEFAYCWRNVCKCFFDFSVHIGLASALVQLGFL